MCQLAMKMFQVAQRAVVEEAAIFEIERGACQIAAFDELDRQLVEQHVYFVLTIGGVIARLVERASVQDERQIGAERWELARAKFALQILLEIVRSQLVSVSEQVQRRHHRDYVLGVAKSQQHFACSEYFVGVLIINKKQINRRRKTSNLISLLL